MHHHACVGRNRSLHTPEQDEGTHRLAIGVRRKHSTLIILTIGRTIDEPANCRNQFQLAYCTSQRNGTEHGAAIGIDCDCCAGQITALRKDKEIAWRIRGNGAAKASAVANEREQLILPLTRRLTLYSCVVIHVLVGLKRRLIPPASGQS
jgi:hypothetical protein